MNKFGIVFDNEFEIGDVIKKDGVKFEILGIEKEKFLTYIYTLKNIDTLEICKYGDKDLAKAIKVNK